MERSTLPAVCSGEAPEPGVIGDGTAAPAFR